MADVYPAAPLGVPVLAAQEFVTAVYLATQGRDTIGEIAYCGFTAGNPQRIAWESLTPDDRQRWQQSGTAVLVHWRDRTGGT